MRQTKYQVVAIYEDFHIMTAKHFHVSAFNLRDAIIKAQNVLIDAAFNATRISIYPVWEDK